METRQVREFEVFDGVTRHTAVMTFGDLIHWLAFAPKDWVDTGGMSPREAELVGLIIAQRDKRDTIPAPPVSGVTGPNKTFGVECLATYNAADAYAAEAIARHALESSGAVFVGVRYVGEMGRMSVEVKP